MWPVFRCCYLSRVSGLLCAVPPPWQLVVPPSTGHCWTFHLLPCVFASCPPAVRTPVRCLCNLQCLVTEQVLCVSAERVSGWGEPMRVGPSNSPGAPPVLRDPLPLPRTPPAHDLKLWDDHLPSQAPRPPIFWPAIAAKPAHVPTTLAVRAFQTDQKCGSLQCGFSNLCSSGVHGPPSPVLVFYLPLGRVL